MEWKFLLLLSCLFPFESVSYVCRWVPNSLSKGLLIQVRHGSPWREYQREKVSAFEKQVIEYSIREHGGSLKATYEALGVSRKTLYDKIQKHEIDSNTL